MSGKHIFHIALAVAAVFIGFEIGQRVLAGVGTPAQ